MSSERSNERFFTPPLIVIFVTVFIDLVGFGIVIPILPFYANNPPFNASPLEVGMLWSIYSWMQFFFAPILGRLSDRYGRRPILFISLLGSAIGFLILGLAGSMLALFIGRIVGGITGANISTAQAPMLRAAKIALKAWACSELHSGLGLSSARRLPGY